MGVFHFTPLPMITPRRKTIATALASELALLWLDNKLTYRRVAKILDTKFPTTQRVSGAFRSTLLFPEYVIKVPHEEVAVKSTILEARIYKTARANPRIAKHFPNTHLMCRDGIPVLVQERVPYVATEHPLQDINTEDHPLHRLVALYAKEIGIGDIHLGNYGWKRGRTRHYPVFFDCELTPRGYDLKLKHLHKLSEAVVTWDTFMAMAEGL
jgi:hypothetical protein